MLIASFISVIIIHVQWDRNDLNVVAQSPELSNCNFTATAIWLSWTDLFHFFQSSSKISNLQKKFSIINNITYNFYNCCVRIGFVHCPLIGSCLPAAVYFLNELFTHKLFVKRNERLSQSLLRIEGLMQPESGF